MSDTFFKILKKSVVGSFALIFAFVVLYTPQQIRHVNEHLSAEDTVLVAEAFGFTDIANLVQNTVSAVATLGLHTKEFVLDGLAWAIAKGIVQSMIASLIDWINSGFKGSPAFVQDFERFLLDAADRAAGEYIDSLGGIGSFICSPFQLDIQIALAIKYQTARERKPLSTCTLSGIVNNLEGFLEGTSGGWDDWVTITTQPEKYTPYGQLLEAESGMRIVLAGENFKNVEEVRNGNGFLPLKKCETTTSANGAAKENCKVVTPGTLYKEGTASHLDTGRQSLIEADEFNELIAALLGQLANKALTGAAGLLGLSASTNGGSSYTSALANATTGGVDSIANQQLTIMSDSLKLQKDYKALASKYAPLLQATSLNQRLSADVRSEAKFEFELANKVILNTADTIPKIDKFVVEYTALVKEHNASSTTAARKIAIKERQAEIIASYSSLSLYRKADIDYSTTVWRRITGI